MPEDTKTPNVAPSRPTKGTPLEPGKPQVVEAVTGRENDTPMEKAKKPSEYPVPNSTFADRVKHRDASEKRISSSQNKAVQSSKTK